MRALPLVLLVAVVLTIAAAGSAAPDRHAVSANHGYQGYMFHNTTGRVLAGFTLQFDREISHLGDQIFSWGSSICKFESKVGARCADRKTKEYAGSCVLKFSKVECSGFIDPGERVKVFVSTPPSGNPPSYVPAKLTSWEWKPVNNNKRSSCRLPACEYLGITSPTPANVPGPPG